MKMLPTAEEVIEAVKKGKFAEVRKMSETLEAARASFLQSVSYKSWGLDGVKMWINAGIDVNVRDEKTGRTALHIAMANGNQEAVRLLVDNGADRVIFDFKGNTPGNLAASEDMLKLLDAAVQTRNHSRGYGAFPAPRR